MVEDNRVTARLGPWFPPEKYNQPLLEPDAGAREVRHQVLGDREVVQIIGENAETFRFRGDAYEEDIQDLRVLNGEQVSIRHSVFSGQVVVLEVSARSTSSYDTVDGERKWVYNYTVDLVEAVNVQ